MPFLLGAVSCRTARDARSGPDADRIYAAPIEINTIVDDTLDVPEGDATDWQSIEVTELSDLAALLHFDNPTARLELALHDALGQPIARAQPKAAASAPAALEVVVPKCLPGRYFARIQAVGDDAKTSYSLKIVTSKAQAERCHNCTPGQQICLGLDGYAVCETTPEGCNAWVKTFACKTAERCREGSCVAGCTNQCKEEERRCASDRSLQICSKTDDGCLRFSDPSPCGSGEVCQRGACRKAPGSGGAGMSGTSKSGEPDKARVSKIRARIISMVKQGTRMMLHIEVGESNPVKVGARGWVLAGDSEDRLTDGEFKVSQVTGKYCIATTDLKALGKNRTVEIESSTH